VAYLPAPEILERYAAVLVDFALGSGRGVQPGEVVRLVAPESAKPLYVALNHAVWRAGGHVIGGYQPSDDDTYNLSRDFFESASEAQLDHLAARYMRGLVDEMDHQVSIIADTDPRSLDSVDPARIMRRGEVMRPVLDWRGEKENAGRFTWTLALYGTAAMAAEAGMSQEEYWEQIVHACYLDEADPVARWREVGKRLDETRRELNALDIESLHIEGEDVDLRVSVGERRHWLGGRGRNIPSFEIFTSPDWRGTEGWIYCNQPLYRYGNLVRGIRLEFDGGKVKRASAEENERVLLEMIATPGADRIGEFSLTDRRYSRITRFMAHTLYDENVGGEFGNTHIALGRSYQDAYDGDPAGVAEAEWQRLGFNQSSVHTDIVSTSDRRVTASLRDGGRRVIYADGEFQLDGAGMKEG
jgi:aminopeptidase